MLCWSHYHTHESGDISYRRGQRTRVADRQNIQTIPRTTSTLHLFNQPVSAPLGHRLITSNIFRRNLLTVFYQVLRDRARISPCI